MPKDVVEEIGKDKDLRNRLNVFHDVGVILL